MNYWGLKQKLENNMVIFLINVIFSKNWLTLLGKMKNYCRLNENRSSKYIESQGFFWIENIYLTYRNINRTLKMVSIVIVT